MVMIVDESAKLSKDFSQFAPVRGKIPVRVFVTQSCTGKKATSYAFQMIETEMCC